MAAIAGLDRIDRQILRLLQQDAQITNLDLSARVHLSPDPSPQEPAWICNAFPAIA